MSWDAAGYGSHSETAVKSPATTWYLAEGATIGGFVAVLPAAESRGRRHHGAGPLLAPDRCPADQDLRPAGALARQHLGQPVEEFPGLGRALADAEISAVIESQDGTPIIVERAMYRSNQGRVFNAGHESTGVSTPATDWFLAEGATGDFFDMFVLIANPTSADAAGHGDVSDRRAAPRTAGPWWRRPTRAPGSGSTRSSSPACAGTPLADAALSTTVRSTNGVPLVVERAMWWPGDSSTWHEAHNSAGSTVTGTRWAVAEGEVGGARGHETYLLIANTSAFAGSATVTLLFEDGTSRRGPTRCRRRRAPTWRSARPSARR